MEKDQVSYTLRNVYTHICQVLWAQTLTGESSPACNIAGVVVFKDGASRRNTAQLNSVTQCHRLGQLDQGNVVSEWAQESQVTAVVYTYCVYAHKINLTGWKWQTDCTIYIK